MKHKYFYIHLNTPSIYEKNGQFIFDSQIRDKIIVFGDKFFGFNINEDHFHTNRINISKITNFNFGPNFVENEYARPSTLHDLNFEEFDVTYPRSISVYNKHYLIVDSIGLKFIREQGVEEAQSDFINMDVEKYFKENKQFFWMPENIREVFIKKFVKKRN